MANLKQDAIDYVKTHQKRLVKSFCNLDMYPKSQKPFTLFMAGSPGSGKTEFSKALIHLLEEKNPAEKILRLDIDELRKLLPMYKGNNSDQVQTACTILFDKIYDQIQKNGQSVLVDGTFSSPKSFKNIERALNRKRKVGIIYLYLDPIIAWQYTQKREKIEGRTVPKEIFINAYFKSHENVNHAKGLFGNRVILHLFIKTKDHNFQKKALFNIPSLKNYLKEKYSHEFLEKKLPDKI